MTILCYTYDNAMTMPYTILRILTFVFMSLISGSLFNFEAIVVKNDSIIIISIIASFFWDIKRVKSIIKSRILFALYLIILTIYVFNFSIILLGLKEDKKWLQLFTKPDLDKAISEIILLCFIIKMVGKT